MIPALLLASALLSPAQAAQAADKSAVQCIVIDRPKPAR